MQAEKALDSLYICAGLLESSFLNNVIVPKYHVLAHILVLWGDSCYLDILLIDQDTGAIKEKYLAPVYKS